MKEELEILELIDRYLQGTLDEQEIARVEERIKADTHFAEQVQEMMDIDQVVMAAGFDMLREKMTKDIAQLDREKSSKFNKGLGGAVVVLLAAFISLYFYSAKDSRSESAAHDENKNETLIEKKAIIHSSFDSADAEASKFAKTIENSAGIYSSQLVNKDTFSNASNNTDEIIPANSAEINSDIVSVPASTNTEAKQHTDNNTLNQDKPLAPCRIHFSPVVNAACLGKTDGSIEILPADIRGGKSPYIFILNEIVKQSSGFFGDLAAGRYRMEITDAAGCSATQEIVIMGKNCSTVKAYNINPEYGEIWKIPVNDGESGKFTIINKAGIIIFKGIFGNGESNEWGGADMNGNLASVGMYSCILEYTGGKTENMQITVIR